MTRQSEILTPSPMREPTEFETPRPGLRVTTRLRAGYIGDVPRTG